MELSGIRDAGIIVTGAAQGIGEGVARHLAAGGARLALIDRQAEQIAAMAGTWLVTRHVARHMTENKSGSIVTVSSNAARVPRVRQGAYCASKAGVSHLMRVFALELGPTGIRVNTVAPGATETPMIRRMMEGMGFGEAMLKGDLDNFRTGVPLGRIAQVDDVADAVAFLLSDKSRYITMHEMVVDGGATLGA